MENYLPRSTPLKVGPKVRIVPLSSFQSGNVGLQWASSLKSMVSQMFPRLCHTLHDLLYFVSRNSVQPSSPGEELTENKAVLVSLQYMV